MDEVTRRLALALVLMSAIAVLSGWVYFTYCYKEKDAMFVRVESALSNNLAVVRGVKDTPTAKSFLAEFERVKSADGKSLRDCVGENITIEYRWKGDRAIVRVWQSGLVVWNVVGMRYEAPEEVR
jgi:hypothetical protein